MGFVLMVVALGFVAVLQVSINRQIALKWGLSPAVLLNAVVLSVVASLLFVVVRARGASAFVLRPSIDFGELRWWWFLPGVFGFLLVTLLPLAAHHVGVLRVFVGLVAAQMVASLLWDLVLEKIPVTATRGLGAMLAVVSVALVSAR